jgi:capsular polysaccharide transport system permease protein
MLRLSTEAAPDADFRRGLKVQAHCIHALAIRDMMMRYGRGNIGFLWVVLEPMILCTGVLIVRSILNPPSEHGVQLVALVLTGYMPLTLWRHMLNGGTFLFRRSAALLYHRNISLLDAFLSRMLLEFIGTTTALAAVSAFLLAAGIIDSPHDFGLMAAAWLLKGFLSFGLALNFAVLTEYSEVSEKFVAPFQYLMLPLSGTFFLVAWLPTHAQSLIWYNPTVHCYEMFRAGFFGEEVETHYVIWYPLVWSVGLTTFGLWGLERVRDRIHFG